MRARHIHADVHGTDSGQVQAGQLSMPEQSGKFAPHQHAQVKCRKPAQFLVFIYQIGNGLVGAPLDLDLLGSEKACRQGVRKVLLVP